MDVSTFSSVSSVTRGAGVAPARAPQAGAPRQVPQAGRAMRQEERVLVTEKRPPPESAATHREDGDDWFLLFRRIVEESIKMPTGDHFSIILFCGRQY